MSKNDKVLGYKVKDYLIQKGVETPETGKVNTQEAKSFIEVNFRAIMDALKLDLTDDSLKDTPKRVAKMYVDELFYGLNYDLFPKCTAIKNKMSYEGMLLEKNIILSSSCEHHFLTIDGFCHIAYIPKDLVIGLSKLNRITDFFAKRPQVQERLTEQIYYALNYILKTEDIAVIIDATHFCVKARGIKDTTSSTITSKLGGKFKTNQSLRVELFNLLNK